MSRRLKIMGLVPARGGSKRLPGKNMKEFRGKPLIYWTLNAAKESSVLDVIAVSSDMPETLDFAEDWGAFCIRRPPELATDTANSADVAIHAMAEVERSGRDIDALMLLQPTSPLRTSSDIVDAVERMTSMNADSVISVVEVSPHPALCHPLSSAQRMDQFLRNKLLSKSESLAPHYYYNGALYLVAKSYLVERRSFVSPETVGLIMPRERSIDIDTEADFVMAEALSKYYEYA